jgi:hypothetical protein
LATIRETIVGLAITYLNADTAVPRAILNPPTPPVKPSGLTVHRERTRPIEEDQLPAILVYFEDEAPKSIGSNYRAPLVERDMTVAIELRAEGSPGVSPDEAIDPLYEWAIYQIFGNESFGGIANGVEEGKTAWHSKEGDKPLAAATTHLSIKFRTSRIDPSSRT